MLDQTGLIFPAGGGIQYRANTVYRARSPGPNFIEKRIVFLTGLATLENRVQSSLSGGNDFIAKPFNLHELSVKAITLLLKAQLHLA